MQVGPAPHRDTNYQAVLGSPVVGFDPPKMVNGRQFDDDPSVNYLTIVEAKSAFPVSHICA
jgi:hypothetical protein